MNVREMIVSMRMPPVTADFKALHERIQLAKLKGNLSDEILNECKDAECVVCGAIACPGGEPLHFHHDGCPSCDGGV